MEPSLLRYTSSNTLKLGNGLEIPRKGLGTFQGDNFKEVITTAIGLGYRHIDTARAYSNEKALGAVLSELFTGKSLKREELWITTKILNNPDVDIIEDVRGSLEDLKVGYVDLLLIHWPFGKLQEDCFTIKQTPMHIVWEKMEECVRLGLTRSIGVSNFNCQMLCDLMSYCKIKPAILQLESHPYLPQTDLINFCQRYGIQITAYSPLCRGGLQPKKTLGDVVNLLSDPLILELSQKYNRTPAQIALNWNYSRNVILIPKTENPKRLLENFTYDDFEMTESDLERITALNRGIRAINPKNKGTSFKGLIPLFD